MVVTEATPEAGAFPLPTVDATPTGGVGTAGDPCCIALFIFCIMRRKAAERCRPAGACGFLVASFSSSIDDGGAETDGSDLISPLERVCTRSWPRSTRVPTRAGVRECSAFQNFVLLGNKGSDLLFRVVIHSIPPSFDVMHNVIPSPLSTGKSTIAPAELIEDLSKMVEMAANSSPWLIMLGAARRPR